MNSPTVTVHVSIAVSLDGFIARPDGDIDWLLQRDDPNENYGYQEFIADKDIIILGRGSYEKILTLDKWLYDIPALVMSEHLAGSTPPERLTGKVSFTERTPLEVMSDLEGQNVRRVYLDGGLLVQSFLRDGLISDMVITTVPVLIGSGRPLFGTLTKDIPLKLVAHRSFPSGMVQATYQVMR